MKLHGIGVWGIKHGQKLTGSHGGHKDPRRGGLEEKGRGSVKAKEGQRRERDAKKPVNAIPRGI
jgi:hypothetical protein